MKHPDKLPLLSPEEKIKVMRKICREFRKSGIDLMNGFLWYQQAMKSENETVPMTAPTTQTDNVIGLSAFDKYCLDHKVIDGGSHA